MTKPKITLRVHALQRMFERAISMDELRALVERGKTIEDRPDDTPFPSRLVHLQIGPRHLHAVLADNPIEHEVFVITVYEPDPPYGTPAAPGAAPELHSTDTGHIATVYHAPMTCPICHHGSLAPGLTTVTLERAQLTLVFKSVPARVCDNCGEQFLDESVSAALIEQAEAAAKAGVQVEVRQYAAA